MIARRRLLVGTAGLILLEVAPVGPAQAADAAINDAVVRGVNAFRQREGLPPLRANAVLDRASDAHSKDMLAQSNLSHSGSDGSTPGQRATRAGYVWRSIRENVAAGQADAKQVVEGWINSPGHRANMLATDVTELGVGFAAAPGMMQGNIPRRFWTLMLAAPR